MTKRVGDGMKPSQLSWKWLLFGLLGVLAFGTALIPELIGDTSRFEDRVTAELSSRAQTESKQASTAGATTASRHSINSMPIAISVPTTFGVSP
jgi:hypothetical protein